MTLDDSELFSQVTRYSQSRRLRVESKERLGHGSDGSVWKAWDFNTPSALKAFYREQNYYLELECYRRLKADDVGFVGGFAVPYLEGWDDALMVIQMSIVRPPYLLDFGKVYLDHPPTYLYDEQLLKNAHAKWRERFGSQWTKVVWVIELLKDKYGIYYFDLDPPTSTRESTSMTSRTIRWKKTIHDHSQSDDALSRFRPFGPNDRATQFDHRSAGVRRWITKGRKRERVWGDPNTTSCSC